MEDKPRTLGEHLEELRGHVGRAVLYLVVAGCACLFFQDELMRFVTAPHVRAMLHLQAQRRALLAQRASDDAAAREQDGRAIAAAQELARALRAAEAAPPSETAGVATDSERRRIAARVLAAEDALARLSASARVASPTASISATEQADDANALGADERLRFLGYSDAMLAYLKVAFICGFIIASPLIIWELWKFVASGLKPGEFRLVRIFAPVSLVCFFAGCAFGYYFLIPQTLVYLASYGAPDLFSSSVTIEGYLDLFLGLTAAVGVSFELPLIMVFAAKVGLVDLAFLRKNRRYWLFIATVLAACMTPTADPWTMCFVAMPLLALYEAGIIAIKFLVLPRGEGADREK